MVTRAGSTGHTVHPHARGDNAQRLTVELDQLRFTPTRVGTTNGHEGRLHRTHGSPPRAWGQPNSCRIGRLLRRFTPTRVRTTARSTFAAANSIGSPPRAWGQRSPATPPAVRRAVHPHARGDNATAPCGLVLGHRFTPTRVGTTGSGRADNRPGPVHPHARGDNATKETDHLRL